ncbi:protein fosB isoform X2 [Conger conger]|uniref:protein fosB isoform X2 n=1 Tax=Conger conger TaxID=82655 RepID=UPI002A5A46DE|nr:protein fosB isoform X2 [Conger conger]
MQLVWRGTENITPEYSKKVSKGGSVSLGSAGEMFQGFPGDLDSGSRGSSSPSIESQYLSSVDSFGSPPTTSAPQECASASGGAGGVGGSVGEGGEMPGSFVPTVTAITTSQDLQWMVQPTLSSAGQSAPGTSAMAQPAPLDTYELPGPSYSSGAGYTPPAPGGDAPGPVRQSRTRSRRARDESLTPEEEEKRRVRRERNKLAAAKCRNRRRELTDRLQSETDILEEEKAELEAEISELQKEKERLEFVLVAHQPGCKIPYHEEQASAQLQPAVSVVGLTVKEDTFYLPPAYTPHPSAQPPPPPPSAPPQPGMMQEVAFSSSFYAHSEPALGGSCLAASACSHDIGSCTPSYTSSFVFTYPEGACGVNAHQRNSSSDQSSDSLNSPSLLAL